MTCIVGVVHNDVVYLGGDSAASNTEFTRPRCQPKVFYNGPYLIGYTSSFRMGQLLQHAFDPPVPPDHADDLQAFMVTQFINAMRGCLSDGGWLRKSEEREKGGNFLVGVKGHLFEIESDLQVGEYVGNCAAVGSGYQYAYGSLHTTRNLKNPRKRITAALEAAAALNPFVSPPFRIIKEQE